MSSLRAFRVHRIARGGLIGLPGIRAASAVVLRQRQDVRPSASGQGVRFYCSQQEGANKPEAASASSSSEFYDVIIAGGGLVGTTMAVALGQLGLFSDRRIVLLEAAPKLMSKEPAAEGGYSNRVVAVSPKSKGLLERLGIWKNVWRAQPVSCLQVWDALSDANIAYNYPDYAEPVCYIVENAVLGYAIVEALKQVPNVEVKFGSTIKSCVIPSADKYSDRAAVSLNDGNLLSTDLLIGADGCNSRVRSAMNSSYLGFNYNRTAVVATLKLQESVDNRIAWQRFLPTGGPIALLPLSDKFSSLVWSTTPEKAKTLLEMNPNEFVDSVNSAFWHEYEQSPLVKKSAEILSAFNLRSRGPRIFPPSIVEVEDKSRAAFPLGFGHSSYYVSRRAALIGDAAHRVHPLAGQGLNLGFGDIDTLQRVLNEAVGMGGDIGSLHHLKEYETERQRCNVAIQGGIDFLHRLYDTDFAPVVALRSVGLSLVNSSDVLKKMIMTQAAA